MTYLRRTVAVFLLLASLVTLAACTQSQSASDISQQESETESESVIETEPDSEALPESESESESAAESESESESASESETESASESESESEKESKKETTKKPTSTKNPTSNKKPAATSKPATTEEEKPKPPAYKYIAKVNNQANVVTIYTYDEDGNYTVPYKAMICSTGSATPKSGIYSLSGKYKWKWKGLFGNVYGRYTTQITGNILFHSVPYLTKGDNGSLKYAEFDKLGTSASMGCIRLQLKDALWIYNNKSNIKTVEFYSSGDPGPLGKPSAPKISGNVTCRNWDPTDTDPTSPWLNPPAEEPDTTPNTEPDTTTEVESETGSAPTTEVESETPPDTAPATSEPESETESETESESESESQTGSTSSTDSAT